MCLSLILLGATSITPARWASPQVTQQPEVPTAKSASAEVQHEAGPPTALAALVEEVKKNAPAILAAERAAKAATYVALNKLAAQQVTVRGATNGNTISVAEEEEGEVKMR